MYTYLDIALKVNEYFNDWDKTSKWLHTITPALGYVTPDELIRMNKSQQVMNLVEKSFNENRDSE